MTDARRHDGKVRHNRGVLLRTLTLSALLCSPFLGFATSHGYPLGRLELGLVVGMWTIVALAGAIVAHRHAWLDAVVYAAAGTLFLDAAWPRLDGSWLLLTTFLTLSLLLRSLGVNVSQVVPPMAFTLLISTLALSGPPAAPHSPHADGAADKKTPAGRDALPFVLHVVLDEHIGVEGVPADGGGPAFKAALKAFYEDRGFRLYGGAFAEFNQTQASLAQLLNRAPGIRDLDSHTFLTRRERHTLTRASHFASMASEGYALDIIQSSFLDICAAVPRARCETYDHAGLAPIADLPVSTLDKTGFLLRAYLTQLTTAGELREHLRRLRRLLPQDSSESATGHGALTSSLNAVQAFDRLEARIKAARRGTYVFAHLLIPHFPYSFDEACGPRPPADWLDAFGPDVWVTPIANSAGVRAAKYEAYYAQTRCVLRHLDHLISIIPPEIRDDAIVVVHGDHGSRISAQWPQRRTKPLMKPVDYYDTFSTIFAVRSSGLRPEYVSTPISLSCVFTKLAAASFQTDGQPHTCEADRAVFFLEPDGTTERVTYPEQSGHQEPAGVGRSP